jgi:hypothetical protein
MANATRNRATNRAGRQPNVHTLPVAAAVHIYEGTVIGVDASGNAGPLSATYYNVRGVAQMEADNSAGAAAALYVNVEEGVFVLDMGTSSDAFTNDDRGLVAYASDDHTGNKTDGTASRPPMGVFLRLDPDSTTKAQYLIEAGPVHGLVVRSCRIQHSDLTAAATTESKSVGSGGIASSAAAGALPDVAHLAGWCVDVDTAFSGGSVSACTLKLGTAADDDALATAIDVFTGATGFPKAGTAGVLGFMGAPWGGETLTAKFTTTTDNTVSLSAGDVNIHAYFRLHA